ncbi:MAG: ABC transporter [Proteobacteria bacterium]|nr:MAG: ABC transporter [Pseudomonadota bacterium]
MPAGRAALECRALTVTVAGRTLVRALDFSAQPGTVTCILGRNGTGKTLTLHTLAGLRQPHAGRVTVAGRALGAWPRRELAQRLGLLLQLTEDPFPTTVLESVLIGRHPHIGFWQWESRHDRDIAHAALAAVGLDGFASRDVTTLSGGERRRAAIATLLAQDPDIMLLDEPTNHLDPHHQLDVLRLFRARAAAGRAVVMSLHDAGLAARFADRALLLFGDGNWLCGPSREILTEDTMTRLYGVPVRQLDWADGRTFVAL